MRRLTLPTGIALIGAGFFALMAAPVGAADTDFVRELAKNKTRIVIVTSGAEANDMGTALEQNIQRHGEFGKSKRGEDDVKVITLADAEKAYTNRELNNVSIIFLLCGKDNIGTPPVGIMGLLPFAGEVLASRMSRIDCAKDKDKPSEPIFRVGMYAPDKERLRRIYDLFMARKAKNFRDLPFNDAYATNRVAIFSSPAYQSALNGWGESAGGKTWDDCHWHSLAERDKMTPEQLEECNQVYFLDRSERDAAAPEAASKMMEGQTIRSTSIILAQGQSAAHDPILVLSSPSRLLLETRMKKYRSVAALSQHPALIEAKDLRSVGKASVLILTGDTQVQPTQAAGIYDFLAKDLRENLRMTILPRGPVLAQLEQEVELQKIQGASGAAMRKRLRNKMGSRYVWLFRLTEFSGATQYEPTEDKMTPTPPPFTDREPQEPERSKKESDEDLSKRLRQYRKDHQDWEERKGTWRHKYYEESVEWDRKVMRTESSRAHGLLQLWDLENQGGMPIWEMECHGSGGATTVERTEHTSVRGHEEKPSSLNAPAGKDGCEVRYMYAAARQAADTAIAALMETALLPDGKSVPAVAPLGDSGGGTPTPRRTVATGGKIADVEGSQVALNIGATQGVKVGDRFVVALKIKEIRDPDTDEVKDIRVLESVTLKVIRVGATADCAPATPQDAAKMGRVKRGMTVQKVAGVKK